MITDTKQVTAEPATLCAVLELAAKEVFDLMVGAKLEGCLIENATEFDTTAMIGLAGNLCGVISVRCGAATSAYIASRMLGSKVEATDASARDALAEIVNMVAGNFKSKLNGSEHCMLSIPTVITGADYQLRSLAVSHNFQLLLVFEEHPITVSMELHG